jgi:hypothetical protein
VPFTDGRDQADPVIVAMINAAAAAEAERDHGGDAVPTQALAVEGACPNLSSPEAVGDDHIPSTGPTNPEEPEHAA